jgi:hypothetical protein
MEQELQLPSTAELEALLDDLCVKLRFCLAGETYDRLVDDPPTDPAAFAEAVMSADGGDPHSLPGDVYAQVLAEVERVFASNIDRLE